MSRLNIYARKDGRFEGRIYLGKSEDGRRRYKSYYGATAEEVHRKYEIAQLSYVPSESVTKMTVSGLAAEWLLSVKNRIKESTLANYRLKLVKHILPCFGALGICSLGNRDIYAFKYDTVRLL